LTPSGYWSIRQGEEGCAVSSSPPWFSRWRWRTGTTLAAEEESPSGTFGPEHPDTLTTKSNLALTLWNQGDYAGARDLFEQVLQASTRTLGPEHPGTLLARDNLAATLAALDEAA
jgi:hypothetical protein